MTAGKLADGTAALGDALEELGAAWVQVGPEGRNCHAESARTNPATGLPFVCTLLAGHEGSHESWVAGPRFRFAWPQEEKVR